MSATGSTAASFCRVCHFFCPILVDVEDGRVASVTGDRENAVYEGHTCIKGQLQHRRMYHADRLLHSLKRQADGSMAPIPVEQAMDEIAERLEAVVAEHGARAIAGYLGTYFVTNLTQAPMFDAFMRAIGSPMVFSPVTIDKPGKSIARALHGVWLGGPTSFDAPEAMLLVGINPLVAHTGLPFGTPRWLSEQLDRGARLIVVDPRRSDIARRASIFLQPRPGTDPLVLAGMIHVILDEGLHDADFVSENVSGLDDLRRTLAPLTPEVVATRAGVDRDALVEAARVFGRSRRGFAVAGTGPSFSGPGTLNEYLILVLEALTGHYLREGERVVAAATLLPTETFKAQAAPPQPARFGVEMRVRGLTETHAGLPTAAVADEILLEGEGRLRALISCSGNPAAAWPNQQKVVRALRSLDLLVQIDPWLSQTARLADYVIAPKLSLETPGTTQLLDFISQKLSGWGLAQSYAQYSPAIVDPPEGSDLIEEWEFFYGLAQRLELELQLTPGMGFVSVASSAPTSWLPLDMAVKPTSDALLELLSGGARVPLDEVKHHAHGSAFPEPPVHVLPREPGWPHRLEVASPEMMSLLGEAATAPVADDVGEYPFRLVSRRTRGMFNSSVNDGITTKRATHNPAYFHPDDVAALELEDGALVEIRSPTGKILGMVASDRDLRRGVISMAHAYGDLEPPQSLDDYLRYGSSVAVLIDDEVDFDPFSGQPRMSNVPVAVTPLPGSTGS
jgi:anaerobic selenocysteine-containing dehydrogenase